MKPFFLQNFFFAEQFYEEQAGFSSGSPHSDVVGLKTSPGGHCYKNNNNNKSRVAFIL